MLGTLHARGAAEAVRVMCYAAEIDPTEIATPFVFVVIAAGWIDRNIVRRVVEVGFLAPDDELAILTSPDTDDLHLSSGGAEALARWSGLNVESIQHAIGERARRLAAPSLP
jgi:hypothetical protein